ncbi:MAG: ferritin [Bacteroidetes bacterium]|nr:ferritin [Bacteroidota bacterium]MDA1332977.1 ferritin [Bacteroidota bacterium]
MNKRTLDAVNNQIQAEFQSAYIYLSMSAIFEDMKMSGAANWMRIQWQEETAHAMKLFDHLIRRGQAPDLQSITAPDVTFESALDAFEQVLEHERHVTRLIHSLYEVAVEEKDYALQTLLHWYIDEQVEEEENAEAIIDSLRLAGSSGQGLFMVDRELGLRTPEAEGEE